MSTGEDMVESHETHCELAERPCDLFGFPKLGSRWNQIQDRSLYAPPSMFTICETDPAIGKKPAFQFREFIEV
jgi:hypothetical protein